MIGKWPPGGYHSRGAGRAMRSSLLRLQAQRFGRRHSQSPIEFPCSAPQREGKFPKTTGNPANVGYYHRKTMTRLPGEPRSTEFIAALNALETGRDDAARPEGANRGTGGGAGPDLAVDLLLAHPPRDQLGVLGPEVEDQDHDSSR